MADTKQPEQPKAAKKGPKVGLGDRIGLAFKLGRIPTDADVAAEAPLIEARDRVKAAEHAHTDRIKAAEARLNQAVHGRQSAINNARAAIGAAKAQHEQRVADAQAAIRRWTDVGRGERVASFRGITVYEHQVATPNGEAPLLGAKVDLDIKDARFNVQVTSGKTSFVVQDALASGPALDAVATEVEVRKFASDFEAAVAKEAAFDTARREAMPSLEAALKDATSDMSVVKAAETEAARVERDPALQSAIEQAQDALTAAKADTAELDAAEKALRERTAGRN